ncbi:MAG: four-helix bundle copper-binding protein [Dehalococcoidia bacterium]|nr:four-helix bundle copper-binding protein [Dehalococcoidia bacterium]
MVYAQEMIRTHPKSSERPGLVEAIDACFDCAQACIACADACLGEPQVASMVKCIRLNLDCAAICQTTGEVLSRQTETVWSISQAQLQACVEACRMCAEECSEHAAHMEHCRICADACRRCEDACRRLAAA